MRKQRRSQAQSAHTAPQEWQLQDAKARFSEVFRLARQRGPQRVTKHGKEAVVIIAAEEYARITAPQHRHGSIAQFFAASPLCNSGIDLDRERSFGRVLDL